MKILWTFFRVALHTTINIIIYLFTQGHVIWLEGRVLRGRFRNWGWRYGYEPAEMAKPATEEELVATVKHAFNRTIYPLHQELEFAVPYADAFPVARRFLALHEELYDQGLPYTLLELRFTPAGHDRTLLGAGQGRHSCWIDVVSLDSEGYKAFYEASEALIIELGGRPHLGKYNEKVDKDYLAQLYGQNFERFRELIAEYDPEGKFANDFTRRLFGDSANGG